MPLDGTGHGGRRNLVESSLAYGELQATSNFSFLRSGSHPDELVAQAKALGLHGIALTDRNTLAGVVRAHVAAKAVGMRFLVGARLDLQDGPSLLCFPRDRAAYGRLCRLLTLGQRRAEKGECHLFLADVVAHRAGQVFVILQDDHWDWREIGVGQTERSQTERDQAERQNEAHARNLDEPQEQAPNQEGADLDRDHQQIVSRFDGDGVGNIVSLSVLRAERGLNGEGAKGAASNERTLESPLSDVPDDIFKGSPEGQSSAETRPRASFAETVRYLSVALRRPCSKQGQAHRAPDGGEQRHFHRQMEGAAAGVYLAGHVHYRGDDAARLAALGQLGRETGVPVVATGDVLYHAPHRRALQDVLTCVRHGLRLDEAGYALDANAERHLKSPAEMHRLFAGFPEWAARTIEIFEICTFSLDELVYEYPDEPVPEGTTPQAHLENLTWEGAAWRYPGGVPDKVRQALDKELALIGQLHYAPYFLTVHDIVAFARSRNILAQGRGSAANSAVCYCLGITAVDPAQSDLLFERFISPERKEPPDIDVDFEHERREEVIQYIYARYGRERAGLAATVISYRARSAVRDVGKVMGLSEDTVAALSGMVWGVRSGGALPEKYVREAGLDPDDERLAMVLELAEDLTGFPRHLSQHVGGFVLTRGPLSEVVPVGNARMADRTTVEWDKDDLAALGLLKIDVLALGMLSCVHRAFDLISAHHGRALSLASVPQEDAETYDMLCRADSIGVFQVESRAQMNMLPRLKPRTFYDLVIEVAIVRPGPIQGDMVHPYLRRRNGLEAETYPSPAAEFGPPDELKKILGRTKGVPLFQEQAMRIAMVAAKFSDADVNELRKAMATFRKRGTIGALQDKMVNAMAARGYDRAFAERCFNQIKGFGEYGFPESHAASFALLVYVSSWIKCHYPDAFCCALLNAQPMGFYAPAQIVRDAREHGVEVRPVDVMHSQWDCTLEPAAESAKGCAVRLGLRQVDGIGEPAAQAIVAAREDVHSSGGFRDVCDLYRRSGVRRAVLERLASADAFGSLGLDRRQALWAVRGLPAGDALPLFAWSGVHDEAREEPVRLPNMPLSEHVVNDYQTLKLSLKAHPMSFLRPRLTRDNVFTCRDLKGLRDGTRVRLAGVVLVRQRPGSAKGVVFMTLEDETGVANAVIWPKTLERFRKVVMGARLVLIEGRVQRHEDIVHVVADRLMDRNNWLASLSERAQIMDVPIARADEVLRPDPGSARGRQGDGRQGRNQQTDDAMEAHGEAHGEARGVARGEARGVARGVAGGQVFHGRWAGHPRNEIVIPKSRDFH